jgi:hypothetical protein
MPPTSEQLPLLGIYYAVTICIVSVSTGMAVLTLRINNKGQRGAEVPRILRKIFFDGIAPLLRIELASTRKLFKKRHYMKVNLMTNVVKAEKHTLISQNRKSSHENQKSKLKIKL